MHHKINLQHKYNQRTIIHTHMERLIKFHSLIVVLNNINISYYS